MKKNLVFKHLAERGSLDSIRNVVTDKNLTQSQIVATVFGLVQKRVMFSLDTGLGKTVLACALLNLTLTKGDKAVFVLKRFSLNELYKKIKSSIRKDLRVGFITSEYKVIDRMIFRREADICDILVISSDSISETNVNEYLFINCKSIKIIVIDEMHLFSNLTSVESRLMQSMVKYSEYAFALTATPFQRDIIQLINTTYVFRPDMFGDKKPNTIYNLFTVYNEDGTRTPKDLNKLKTILKPFVFNVTREMVGINIKSNVRCHLVKAKNEWKSLTGPKATIEMKGNVREQPFFTLCELLNEYLMQSKRGIVYINLNDVKKPVFDRLIKLGYKVGIVDGSISTPKEAGIYKKKYNNKELDFLIINTPTSLDLEGDFVIFYEMTLAYVQTVGRISRGIEDKEINIDFIIVKDTAEEKFFYNNVYQRVKVLNNMYNKGGKELNTVVKELKGYK